MSVHPYDRITTEQLRRRGSLKWTDYPDMLGAAVSEMDFGTAPGVAEAAAETITSGLLGYAPPKLVAALQDATAGWLQRRHGWTVHPGQVRPVPTVIAGLEAAIMHFSPVHRPGAPVVLLTPGFVPFLDTPARFGRDGIQVSMVPTATGWDLDWPALEEALRGGALLVLVNPHSPLGKVYTRAELVRISEIVERTGSRVYADEILSPLVYPGRIHVPYATVSEAAASHSVTGISATKAFDLPGLKCAQLVLTSEADQILWAGVGDVMEHVAANVGLAATVAAYDGGADWLAGVVDYLDGNRQLLGNLLEQHLPAARYIPPEGSYMAWIDVSELSLGRNPARFFRDQAGVTTVNGTACGEDGRGFIRLNFATPRPILEAIVHRMGAAVSGADLFDTGDIGQSL